MRFAMFLSALLAALPVVSLADTVVINSGMGATASSDFTTTQTPDNTVQFGYNWATDATPSQTGYSTIPPSPNGDTVGLKIESNNTNDATNYQEGVTVWCNLQPQTSNYDVEVDAFMAYPLTGTPAGTTEHIGIVIQSNGNGIRGLRNNALNQCNPAFGVWGTNSSYADLSTTASAYPQDGLAFGYNGENGESATDIFCYDPAARTGSPSATLNGQVGTWLAGDPSPYVAHDFNTYSFVLSPPSGRTLGNVSGWLWNTIKAAVRGNTVTFYINGNPIVTYTSTKTAKKVGLIAGDPFASWSSPPSESFFLFDNFKITDVVPSTAAQDWQLFQ
ncbi:MAG: hypothetical protein N2Z21_07815 [Candidatus Sumerlaeaceae bacterium]|nr:hypothetical protein [Candidatus Sumerlaeaceae bacterium]